MLGSKYGKDYVTEASSDALCRKWHVNENLIRCVLQSQCLGLEVEARASGYRVGALGS